MAYWQAQFLLLQMYRRFPCVPYFLLQLPSGQFQTQCQSGNRELLTGHVFDENSCSPRGPTVRQPIRVSGGGPARLEPELPAEVSSRGSLSGSRLRLSYWSLSPGAGAA
jgi:hypothetical protein